MLLEKVFKDAAAKGDDALDTSPLVGDYGMSIYGKIKAVQHASKHQASQKPHGPHKRKGRKTHQIHKKR